ncbi:MAG: polysaccharide biosynthesis protein [Clostridiales bacterium]|nr:polysaccharide biosynthesis protein [Clostridiales bacterium]
MISNIIVKVIGVLFKIPLHNLLGDTGMGYFNAAYSVFTTLYLVSTSGLPTAISMIVSRSRVQGRKKQVNKVFTTALLIFITLGTLGSCLMFFCSSVIAEMMGSPGAAQSISMIAPTLLLISIASSVRGYFQGHQNMVPTAVSEIIESIGKFAVGVVLGVYALNAGKPIETAAAYAIFGVVVGEAVGMTFLVIFKAVYKQDYSYTNLEDDGVTEARKSILISLFRISVPIMLASVVLNLTSTIDAFSIVNLLKKVIGQEAAEAAYGNYTTLAVTLFHLPATLVTPISTSLVPALSAAHTQGSENKIKVLLRASTKLVAIVSIPCAMGLSILAKPILSILFSNAESVENAGILLALLAPAVVFSSLLAITSSILQSFGYQRFPLISMIAGVFVKIIGNLVLISNPILGIKGAPIATLLAYITMATCNVLFVKKFVKHEFKIVKIYVKPLGAGIIASLVTMSSYTLIHTFMGNAWYGVALAIILTAIVYFVFLFIVRALEKDDILFLPHGEKIYRILNRIHLVK